MNDEQRKYREAGLKAAETKGPDERVREAKMANWTRRYGKDDAKNPYSKQNFTFTTPATSPGANNPKGISTHPLAPEVVTLPEEVPQGSTYSEGSVQQILVNRYERDLGAREQCIRQYGTTCVLCERSLVPVYGQLMEGFIHVHHLKPLSSVGPNYKVDPIRDLRPVCPNCHAAVHRREPPYSLDEMRQILQAQREMPDPDRNGKGGIRECHSDCT